MVTIRTSPRLALDIAPLFENNWTGIPIFTRRLVTALLADGRLDLSYHFQMTPIPQARVLAAIRAGSGTLLRQDFEENADVRTLPAPPPPYTLFPSAKTAFGMCPHEASTLHDLSTLFMPETHEESNIAYHLDNLDRELRSNEVTFCVSAATQAALASVFPEQAPASRIIHQYVDWPEEFALFDANLPPLRIGRFAVVVGTIEPRKNLAILLRALALPEVEALDLKFVVVGRKGWLVDEFLQALTAAQRERLVFTGYVSEFMKYRLIKASEFLIFPSLYEGFGIPALEAMSLGKPVLASTSSSFPEIVADAGLYFDPLSASELAAALAEISAPALMRELGCKALARSGEFAPARMVAPVLDWLGV